MIHIPSHCRTILMFKINISLILTLLTVISCKQQNCECEHLNELSQEVRALQNEVELLEQRNFKLTDSLISKHRERKTVTKPSSILLKNTITSNVKIFRAGFFHGEYIDPKMTNEEWFGLYIDSTHNTTLKRIQLELKKTFDPIIDNPGDTTGWTLSTVPEDPLFIISGLNNKQEKIPSLKPPLRHLYPGQSFSFKMNNTWYYIKATGTADDGISNYGLHISSNQSRIPETLAFTQGFDDEMFDILWIGDLDGDSKPDLLLDISDHYNVSHYALFLSSYAEPGKLIAMVDDLRTVGC